MSYRFALASAAAAASLVVGTSSTVGAAASEGAVVIRQQECAPFDAGELCTSLTMISNVAQTPWGYSSTAHGTSSAEYTEDGVVQWSAHQRYRGHLLVKDGEIAEERFALDDLSTQTGMECSITIRLHSTNGQVQYEVDEFVCT
jgi:hypothetical protein